MRLPIIISLLSLIPPLSRAELTDDSQIEPVDPNNTSTNGGTETSFQSRSSAHGLTFPGETSQISAIPTGLIANLSIVDNLNISNETIEDGAKAQFLSFEEWKKVKGMDSHEESQESHLNRIQSQQQLQSQRDRNGELGEEMEIDLSNFFQSKSPDNDQEPEGKLYKDKFNFASFDCGATIVKTNSEAKSATSILFENKDSYLLNPCSAANKFVTIELCQDILVDSVVIGNFEFFSSTFKKISISVSDTFPVPKNGWKNLGVFTAKDLRDFQTFDIENPMIWAKYFRIEILEHYGTEYYCPLSVVRVHGRTMMQEYKQEENEKISKELKEQETLQLKAKDHLLPKPAVCSPSNSSNTSATNCTISPSSNSTVNGTILGTVNSLVFTDESFISDECAVVLPLLKFEEFFADFNRNQSKCELPSSIDTQIQSSSYSQQQQNTGTQESIYKNIMKRLSLLEANATLSVLYIEEQSKLLSSALQSLEKQHSSKLDRIVSVFNATIANQILAFHDLFIQYHTQAESLIASQQLSHEDLLKDSYKRIDLLSNDLKFQKILSFINGLVLFSILIYVVLTRDTTIDTSTNEYNERRISSKIKGSITGVKIYTSYNSDKSYSNSDNEEQTTGPTSPNLTTASSSSEDDKKS